MRDFLSSPDWLLEFLCLKVLFSLLGEGVLLKMVVLCFLSWGGGFTCHTGIGCRRKSRFYRKDTCNFEYVEFELPVWCPGEEICKEAVAT